ncbi:MAG: VG15 protein [Aeromicrobium sp.]
MTAAAATEITNAAAGVALERQADAALSAVGLIVPAYYDAAGSLAVAWYDELRDESRPTTTYAPNIIGDPATDWIEREAAKFRATLDGGDLEREIQAMVDEATRLAEKEVARGFRDSILGNTRMDEDAIGWSRVARPGACKFCVMLSDKGAVYTEPTADFAAHKSCNCAARPEFVGGEHGPEASVVQYLASSKRSRDDRVQAERNARVREYLNEHYPDAPG